MRFLFFFSFLLFLTACSDTNTPVTDTTEVAAKPPPPVSFVKTFVGEVGEYPVHMKLTVDEGKVEGQYFYHSKPAPINVKGEIKVGEVTMKEFDENGNMTGEFAGKIIGGSKLTGTWMKPDGSSKLDFKVIETSDNFGEKFRYHANPHLKETEVELSASVIETPKGADITFPDGKFVRVSDYELNLTRMDDGTYMNVTESGRTNSLTRTEADDFRIAFGRNKLDNAPTVGF